VAQNALRVDSLIGFGGFKQSGIGREGGAEGLSPYLETKTIMLDEDPRTLMAHSKRVGADQASPAGRASD
jgi:hypothetical protein